MDNVKNYEVRKSTRKDKKYMARYKGDDGPFIHFGARGYEHYKDVTGLGLYSNYDHLDPERRRLFKLRHAKNIKRVGSPAWLSDKFLW